MSTTTADIANLVVTGEWNGEALERGLERAGVQYDRTAARMRDGSGRFIAFGDANRRAAAAVQEHNSALVTLTQKLDSGGQAIQRIGQQLTLGLTVPLLAATGIILKIGSDTESSMNRIQGATRATAAEMERVRQKARALGQDLTLPNTSARDAADAMLELAKGGLTLEQSMDAARGTIQLAKAATLGEREAAIITADALNTFALAGDKAGLVADLLAGAASNSSGEVTHMASALAQVGAVARGANVSIEDTVTLISLLAKNGVKGSDAGTSLKTFLLSLQTPVSKEASANITALIGSAYEAGKLKPVTQIIGEFQKSLSGLNEESKAQALREIFGQDAIRAARIIFGEGTEGFNKMRGAVSRSGQAAEQAAAQTKGLAGAWGGLMSVIETVAYDIFEDVKEPITDFVQLLATGAQKVGDVWNALSPAGKAIVGVLAAVAAAAGPVLAVIGMVVTALISLGGSVAGIASAVTAAGGLAAIGTILAPVALVALKVTAVVAAMAIVLVGAAAAIAAAWTTNFGGIRDITFAVFERVKSSVLTTLNTLQEAWARIYPALLSITTRVLAAVSLVWERTGKVMIAAVLTAWDLIRPTLDLLLKNFLGAVETIVKLIDGDWSGAWASFSRVVLRSIDQIIPALNTLSVAVQIAFAKLVLAALKAADDFGKAAVVMVARFVIGFATAMSNAQTYITGVIAQALILAASGVSAEAIGMQLIGRMLSGMRGASAAAGAQEKGKYTGNNFGGFGEDDYAQLGKKSNGQTAPAAPAPGGVGKLNIPGGGKSGGGGGGGGGESAALKTARVQLESIRIIEEAMQRSYERRAQDEQFYYDNGLKSLESYAAQRTTIAKELFDSELKVALAELKVAEQTKGSAAERKNAVAAAQQGITDVYLKYEQSITAIDRDAWKARLERDRTGWANRTALLEETANGFAEIYRRMADQGTMSFRAAGDATSSLQSELLVREQERLKKELNRVDPRSAQAADLQAQLDIIAQKIENFRANARLDAEENDERDYERARSHSDRMRGIWENIADLERGTTEDRLRILEQAGVKETIIWKRRLEVELKAEQTRAARRVAELERERKYVELFEKNEARKAEIIAGINAQIEAEERASGERRANIQEEYFNKERDRLRGQVDKIMGVLDKALNRFKDEGWKGLFKSIGEDFLALLVKMGQDLLKSQLFNLLAKIKGIPAMPGGAPAGNTGGAGGAGTGGGGGLDIIGLIRGVFNGGGQADALSRAGDAATGAIKEGWQDSKREIEQTGDKQAKGLTSVGQSIVSTLLTVGSMLAQANTRGGFWSGLLMAAVSGAASGAMGASFGGGGSGGGKSGGGGSSPGVWVAAGGLLRGPGSGTSDSIMGVDPRTNTPTAWVSNGEYVIRAASVGRLGKSTLDYLNEYGQLPEYNIGGMVRRMMAQVSARAAASSARRGVRRDIGGGAFEFTPPRRADGGAVGALSMQALADSYVPPTVNPGGGREAGGAPSITQHVYLTQQINTPDAPSFHQSARQTARRMQGAINSTRPR